jgi:hypothetical protein
MGSTNSNERRWRLGRMLAGSVCVLCGGVMWLSPNAAHAQGKVITISEVTIVGRVQKPIAAVDVSRIAPKMTLGELRQPFVDRIEKAVYRAPF